MGVLPSVNHLQDIPKNLDNQKICGNHPKILLLWFVYGVMRLINADGMANSVDPDQEQSDLGLHCLLRHVNPKI